MQQVIEEYSDVTKKVYATFIDLEKAYGMVDRNKLWCVLDEWCVTKHILEAVRYENAEHVLEWTAFSVTDFRLHKEYGKVILCFHGYSVCSWMR